MFLRGTSHNNHLNCGSRAVGFSTWLSQDCRAYNNTVFNTVPVSLNFSEFDAEVLQFKTLLSPRQRELSNKDMWINACWNQWSIMGYILSNRTHVHYGSVSVAAPLKISLLHWEWHTFSVQVQHHFIVYCDPRLLPHMATATLPGVCNIKKKI